LTQEGAPLDEVSFSEFLDDYYAECDEHLMGARRLLLALETSIGRGALNRTVLDELFRHFHSLKGISGMVELRAAEELAHRLEDYLRVLRTGDVALTRDGLDALFDGTQTLEQVIAAHRSQMPLPAIAVISARIAHLVASGAIAPDARPPVARTTSVAGGAAQRWDISFIPSQELVARGVRVDTIRKRLASAGEILSAAPRVTPDGAIAFDFVFAGSVDARTVADWARDGLHMEPHEDGDLPVTPTGAVEALPLETDLSPSPPTVAPSHVVRVDLTRLDGLMRNVGDLVISRARLSDTLSKVERRLAPAEWRAIQENAIALDRQLRTLREGIMRVRLVPVGEIFRRMPFVVRDLARETGKRVRLELQGQGTEIDKFLIERMMDPVLHLVRNAVSHGIETADERISAGKRPEGTIVLSAATAGDVVRIEIADDGRGVDAEAVIARAHAAGLSVPPGPPNAATLLSLICAPGFSTREQSDRASGRGVGMSVVKSAVDELSGAMYLESEPGVGTTFILDLPVTLAITDALIARAGGDTFAVPQGSVREVIEVTTAAMLQVERNEMIAYRGGALPIVRLSQLFGIGETTSDRLHVFVVGTGTGALGIAVDRITGQREIVVRTITDPLVRVPGIAGATDLGDGHVVLILDPAVLARQMRDRPSRTYAAGGFGR
jgi:two-component system, chemotaxis family, sensor kinase CheA